MSSISGGAALNDRLQQILEGIEKAGTLKVGFMEEAKYPDGTQVATVAALNEFGGPTNPKRSFFRPMVKDKSPGWGVALGNLIHANNYDMRVVWGLMGEGIKGQLQESIRNYTAVPNSPVTNLLKQRFPMRRGMTQADVDQAKLDVAAGATAPAGKPLIWTADMVNSVTHGVINESASNS